MHIRRALPVLRSKDVASPRRVPPQRRWAAAGLALGAALALGACSDKEEPTVASAAGPNATTAAGGPNAATGTKAELAAYVQSQREWAACLRKNGLPNAAEPNDKGDVEIIVENPNDTSGTEERKVEKTFKACEKLQREMSPELRGSLEPPLTPAQVTAAMGFSECTRKNRVTTFPDPGANGRMDAAGETLRRESSSHANYGKAQAMCVRDPKYVEAFSD